MRLFTLFLPTLAVAGFLGRHGDASPTTSARPASVPASGAPTATSSAALKVLELRQNHGGHGNPNVVPAAVAKPVPTESSIASTTSTSDVESTSATPIVFSTSSSSTSTATSSTSAETSTSSNTKIVITDYTTVRWYESWVGGTYSTWFPTTITVHPPSISPAPQPGKGEIGMGTLTGELQGTKTIVIGAAPSQAPGWAKGLVAAIGVGVVGVLV